MSTDILEARRQHAHRVVRPGANQEDSHIATTRFVAETTPVVGKLRRMLLHDHILHVRIMLQPRCDGVGLQHAVNEDQSGWE